MRRPNLHRRDLKYSLTRHIIHLLDEPYPGSIYLMGGETPPSLLANISGIMYLN